MSEEVVSSLVRFYFKTVYIYIYYLLVYLFIGIIYSIG